MYGNMKPLRATWLSGLVMGAAFGIGCSDGTDGNDAAKSINEDAMEAHADAMMSREEEQAALHRADPAGIYGTAPRGTAVPVAQLLASAPTLEGKRVAVTGTISEVCPMRGCWINLAEGDKSMRVKVTDGQIVFPLSAQGHTATVHGVLQRIDMSVEEARTFKAHLAEEKGEPFDPASVTEPMVLWELQGEGAQITG